MIIQGFIINIQDITLILSCDVDRLFRKKNHKNEAITRNT
jgi:hypothetical protein